MAIIPVGTAPLQGLTSPSAKKRARTAQNLGYFNPQAQLPSYTVPSTNPSLGPRLTPSQRSPFGYGTSGWQYPVANTGFVGTYGQGKAPSFVDPITGVVTDTTPLQSSPADQGPPYSFLGELTSDPLYEQGLTNYNVTRDTLARQRANAFRQAFIQGGFAPGSFQAALAADPSLAGFSGDIDQGAIDAATANQMSTRAQLDRALVEGQAAVPYQLAARGMARSGAAATRNSALQRDYNERSYQALSSLLGALRGTVDTYNQGLIDVGDRWEAAKAEVARRLAAKQGPHQEVAEVAPVAVQTPTPSRITPTGPDAVARAKAAEAAGWFRPYRPPPNLPPKTSDFLPMTAAERKRYLANRQKAGRM